jgi:serine/threonine protein kinase
MSSTQLVKETHALNKHIDKETGKKVINQYLCIKELGRGYHGKVKLALDTNTKEYAAIKIVEKISKKNINSLRQSDVNPHLAKINTEIAILKKCNHPNIVKLLEVMDHPHSHKIYLVLEYVDGGEIHWQMDNDSHPTPKLDIKTCRSYFRDLVNGVYYCNHLPFFLISKSTPTKYHSSRYQTIKSFTHQRQSCQNFRFWC